MATSTQARAYGKKELFRYVKVRPPTIVDLTMRAAAHRDLKRVLAAEPEEQRKWAREFLESGQAVAPDSAANDGVLSALGGDVLRRAYLPTRERVRVPEDLARAVRDESYQRLAGNSLRTVIAHKILDNREEADTSARILQLVEALPTLAKAGRRQRFAPAVLKKFVHNAPAKPFKRGEEAGAPDKATQKAAQRAELDRLKSEIELLWRARTAEIAVRRQELAQKHRELGSDGMKRPRAKPAAPMKKGAKASSKQTAASRTYFDELRKRKETMAAERKSFEALMSAPTLTDVIARPAAGIARFTAGMSENQIAAVQKNVAATLGKYGFKPGDFCQAFDEASTKIDEIGGKSEPAPSFGACFAENPSIVFEDAVRLLGTGELIKVEEAFVGYSEGEISYVENVLAGEIRKRKVKDTKYFEQSEETVTEETTDLTSETTSTVSQNLSSQVETEINSQFNTDVNASASGSGGGTIGVVNLEGSGAVNAGFGLGVDTGFSSSTSSDFAQEIVNKAVEKTKKSTLTRRLSRSYSLFETLNHHEINNTVGDPIVHRRGVYCFLDKHICVSETTYGHRVFLLANLLLPGKNLACEQLARTTYALREQGEKPVFDITPDHVQPATYKQLVARYNAANVNPPPAPTVRLARTYKTDQTNSNTEAAGGIQTVVKALVPFFEQYKRHLITDTVKLPEGYQVQDVLVTVNHGANGISIPAHLPLSLAGASLAITPAMIYVAMFPPVYLPLAMWQIAHLASPLLHYNVDSSNVTVCVGNESQDSPYYFFEPDVLVREIFNLLGNLSALAPSLLETIQTEAAQLLTNLTNNAAALPGAVGDAVRAALNTLVTKISDVINAVIRALDPTVGEVVPVAELGDIATAVSNMVNAVSVDMSALQTLMGDFFTPLQTFFNRVFALIAEAMESAISDFFSFLMDLSRNSQVLYFGQAYGMQRELPVSLNAVTIKPGVTVNLVACLRRTDEAMEQWRLGTFNSLYQAYLQQLADYESRHFSLTSVNGLTKAPATMRHEEQLAIKERVLHTLNNYHQPAGNSYSLNRITLFESAIDWKNISYRLYNYGPNQATLELEHAGIFKGADARRKAFLTAHWAHVLIPLQPDPNREQAMLKYFESGADNVEDLLQNEELAAFYQSLVLDRELADVDPEVVYRPEVVPTDLVVLKLDDTLPENPNTGCA